MAFENPQLANSATCSWSVSGMDCASCATKIRNAVELLPGVHHASLSVMSETLSVTLDEDKTQPEEVEKRVKRLGYGLTRRIGNSSDDANSTIISGEYHEQSGDEEAAGAPAGQRGNTPLTNDRKRWFKTAKGRLVIGTAFLLVSAWSVKLLASEAVAGWAFIAACLIALIPVAKRAFAALSLRQPFTIEMLMTIAATGALYIGAAEEAALVVFLFAVGEVLEGVAADRARTSIRALGDLVPKTARLISGDDIREVLAASLKIDQIVLIRPGDRVPADGEVTEGISSLDESSVTGESIPKVKGPGDEVFAGSINSEAALKLRVTRAPEDNTIARIIRLVEEAQEARAPTERFIDRFSRYYMPSIVALAVAVALVPTLGFGQDWATWIYRALALLLIGCPCALVISVPASIASSLSAGAKRGLLMKGGAVIEAAARTSLVTFDKTGTLTRGKPSVTDIVGLTVDDAEVVALAAAVESGSSHPLAEAILSAAEKQNVKLRKASEQKAIVGRGVSAVLDGKQIFVGSPRYATEEGAMTGEAETQAAELEAEGKTVAVVFQKRGPLGLIALRDEARDDAADGIVQLKALGLRSMMLTGDNDRTAMAIASDLGLEYKAELLPDGKVAAIRDLTGTEWVMMVGDGINDAPALAAAHLGMAMGSGTDVALETADGALLRNRVSDVAATIRLARAAMANIHQNISIALGLKAVFLVTTVFGFTGLWLAILADTGATVLVTLNALRLLRFNPEKH